MEAVMAPTTSPLSTASATSDMKLRDGATIASKKLSSYLPPTHGFKLLLFIILLLFNIISKFHFIYLFIEIREINCIEIANNRK
jgi:hypothetical protein